MDATTLRLLYRLSMAVVVLTFTVVSILVGIELPLGRAGRGFVVVGLLGSMVAIVLVIARLSRRRQPDSALGAQAPDVLVRAALSSAYGRLSAARHRRRRGPRVRAAECAAVEAAVDDGRLAPERIKAAAEALVRLVYLAWDARDVNRLATLLGPELLSVWKDALDANDRAGAHPRMRLPGDVEIDLVGLSAAAGGGHELIVLVEAPLDMAIHDGDGKRVALPAGPPSPRRLCQYWTLALGDGPMIVQAIEERAPGDRHLSEPTVALAHS